MTNPSASTFATSSKNNKKLQLLFQLKKKWINLHLYFDDNITLSCPVDLSFIYYYKNSTKSIN